MNRLLASLVLALSTVALAEETPAAGPAPKLQVITFAALSGEVPQRAGAKAAGMLSTEFKSGDTMQLLEHKKNGATDPNAELLTQAKAAVEEAKGLRAKRKFRLAEESLTKAIELYKKGAAGVTDVGEVVDAYALLAAVQYNTGRDDEGLKSLQTALGLAPDRELPLAATSGLFARLVTDTRTQAKNLGKGSLTLKSTPSGGTVMVDGVTLGGTPLLVKDVPAGLHFFRVQLATGEVVGGVQDVAAGKGLEVQLASTSKDPEARILTSLAQNKVDGELTTAAKEHAAAVGADYLVFGALSKEGKGLTLDSFVYVNANGEVRRLPRASFDTELLSAGMEFFNVAGELQKKGAKVGEVVKVPASVSMTLSMAGPKTAEAKYGVAPGKDLLDVGGEGATGDGAAPADGPRKPLEKKPRAPLQKNK